MNTVKIPHTSTKLIAHRGLSGLERENSCAAFVAAGVKSYFGIETDVHITSDEKYIICHDDSLLRCAGVNLVVEKTPFETLRSIPLHDTDNSSHRSDLFLPPLEDYISICSKYGKQSFLELKNSMPEKHVAGIIDTISQLGWYERTTLISFNRENLVSARKLCPDLKIQFLSLNITDEIIDFAKKYRFGIDALHVAVTEDSAKAIRDAGLPLNAWTINEPSEAERLISLGVDFITTDILE